MRSASTLPAMLFASALFVVFSGTYGTAQSRTNASGTGGMHEIRGKLYLPTGKTLDNPVEVELHSISNFSTLKVITDREGAFAFRNLAPGNYQVVAHAGEQFEESREYITIDTEATGNVPMRATPKVVTVPVYLQFKRGIILRNEVINAKWSTIPKSTLDHFKHGVELGQENKIEEAEAELRKAIEQSPTFAPAYTELGKLALTTGKLDAAVDACKTAIKYDESDFEAHLNLGITYLNLKKYSEAESELVNAAYLNRAAVRPHYYLGLLFVTKGDLDVAQKAFEKAIELNGGKSLPNIHKYLGRIYMKKDMQKEALQELETYIKLAPKAQDADKVKKEIIDIRAKSPVKNAFV
ncbi:MAG TPA: tetratricopeptide repeat protein [Pyrinomonadaceae bacterium]|nr:tetratricopeptide repeat protein [Pyrinomonadaceae bacterium]